MPATSTLPETKPHIFIGSSSERLHLAGFIKEKLQTFADCDIWNEGVFGLNESYFETLIKIPNLYDFAILIATADDKTESRKKLFKAPRDNVIFEFGLFLGRLHRKRVYILQEEKSTVAVGSVGHNGIKIQTKKT